MIIVSFRKRVGTFLKLFILNQCIRVDRQFGLNLCSSLNFNVPHEMLCQLNVWIYGFDCKLSSFVIVCCRSYTAPVLAGKLMEAPFSVVTPMASSEFGVSAADTRNEILIIVWKYFDYVFWSFGILPILASYTHNYVWIFFCVYSCLSFYNMCSEGFTWVSLYCISSLSKVFLSHFVIFNRLLQWKWALTA